MTADITVYTKPACGACIATKHTLDSLGLPYTVVDISKDTDAAWDLVNAGFRAMPVVKVKHESGEDDVWAGFRPDDLAALAA